MEQKQSISTSQNISEAKRGWWEWRNLNESEQSMQAL